MPCPFRVNFRRYVSMQFFYLEFLQIITFLEETTPEGQLCNSKRSTQATLCLKHAHKQQNELSYKIMTVLGQKIKMTKFSFETCCRTNSSLKYHLLYTGKHTKSNILLKLSRKRVVILTILCRVHTGNY